MGRIRVTIWFIIGWTYLTLVYPWSLRAKYLNYRGRVDACEKLAYTVIRLFSKLQIISSGSSVNVSGLDNIPTDGGVIYASNHPGHLDSLIIQGFLNGPKGFIAIDTFEKTPLLGTWMKYMGCVFVDREDARKSLSAMNKAIANLKRGHPMVIFPEGKLSNGKETLAFQKGWLRIARKTGVPIIPVSLSNSSKIMSYDGKKMKPAKVSCVVSKPMQTNNLNASNVVQFLDDLKHTIDLSIV